MSYHNVRNIESAPIMEGQGTAYSSSSDASINEVINELSKKHGQISKQGGTAADDAYSSLGTQGGGLKQLEQGLGNAAVAEFCQKGAVGENKLILKKDAEPAFGEGYGERADLHQKKLNNADKLLPSGGEGFAKKAENPNAWDKTLNNAMLGIGAALGPVGLPLFVAAEARMIQERLSAKSYGESGANTFQNEVIQRQKMLKSWKLRDD